VWILSLPAQWRSLVWQWLALFCHVHLSPCVGLSSKSRCLCVACDYLSLVLWQILALLCAPNESKFQGVCFYCVCWTLECSCVVCSWQIWPPNFHTSLHVITWCSLHFTTCRSSMSCELELVLKIVKSSMLHFYILHEVTTIMIFCTFILFHILVPCVLDGHNSLGFLFLVMRRVFVLCACAKHQTPKCTRGVFLPNLIFKLNSSLFLLDFPHTLMHVNYFWIVELVLKAIESSILEFIHFAPREHNCNILHFYFILTIFKKKSCLMD